MPRVSESALQTIEVVDKTSVELRRVRPPDDLTPEQSQEFEHVVSTMPSWFVPANVAMLAQYARHVVMARRIALLVEAMISGEVEDIRGFAKLQRAQIAESKIIHQLMTAMRMTPQSIQPSRTVSPKRLRQVPSPWSNLKKRSPSRTGDDQSQLV
jgi:hypothetical protein